MSRRRRDGRSTLFENNGNNNDNGNDGSSSSVESQTLESHLTVRVQRKSGFAASKGSDGNYYITKVPKQRNNNNNNNNSIIHVGDRILGINGVSHDKFRDAQHASVLLDSFQLEVEPRAESNGESDHKVESDEGEFEEYSRDRSDGEHNNNTRNNKRHPTNGTSSVNNRNRGRHHNKEEEEDEEEDENSESEESEQPRNKVAVAAGAGAIGAALGLAGQKSRRYDEYIDDDDDEEEEDCSNICSDEDDDDDDEHEKGHCDRQVGDKRYDNDGSDSEDDYRGGTRGSREDLDGNWEDDFVTVDEASRERAKANAQKRNKMEKIPAKEEFERPYVSKYTPNSRFMITVTKDTEYPDHGVILAEYKTKWKREIFVAEVEPHGPFYKTALDRGDKILAINGRKHPDEFKTIQQADRILGSKVKCTLFVMRPDPKKDEGYQWVIENT